MTNNATIHRTREPGYDMYSRPSRQAVTVGGRFSYAPVPQPILSSVAPAEPKYLREVRAIAEHLAGTRQALDCVLLAQQLARIVPFVYMQERQDTVKLIHVLLTQPETFTHKRLLNIARITAAKVGTLPVERRSLELPVMARAANNSRVVQFTASTFAKDRHGTRVRPDGIQTENYERNPVFCWAHDAYGGWSGKPDLSNVIGRTIKLRKSSTALICDVEFLPASVNPRAEQAFQMVREKALSAVSIGFVPLEVIVESEGNSETPVITKAELLEISLVAVPSNAEALVTGRAS